MTPTLGRVPIWAWIVPPLLLVAAVFTLAVDVFHWDEWVIWGEMLHKLDNGTFGLTDLAAQQNEQRNLAARLFGLLLMPVFKLNRFAEYGLNICLAGIGMLAAVRLYAKTADSRPEAHVWLVFSMLSFSLLQWEAFTFGANSSVIILPTALWLGLLVAWSGVLTPLRLVSLGIIGILPSFSFANGLFYWFCLLPTIVLRARKTNYPKLALLSWVTMTVLVWTLYFLDFRSPGHHPSLLSGLQHPLQLIGYFLAYLGGGVSSDKNLFPLAILLGLSSLPLFGTMVFREWQAQGRRRAAMLPWLGAALFTLFSAGTTALARCSFGIEQALESRYASFSTPYWMAIFALFFMAWKRREKSRFSAWFLAFSLAVFLLSTVLSAIVVYNRHTPFIRARQALFSLTDEAALKTIFPDTAYIMMHLPLLMNKRLSVYRTVPVLNPNDLLPETGGEFALAGTETAAEGRVQGLMLHGALSDPESSVILASGNRVVGYLPKTEGVWQIFVPLANLSQKNSRIMAYAVTDNGLKQLAPTEGVPVERGSQMPVRFTFHKHFFIRDMAQ